LANSGWIAQSDANGSYGPTKEYHRISRDIETSPICAWSTFVVFWKSNYSKIKIRRPYMDTCGICFINTMVINTIEHKRKLSRNRMMCMENEFWTDISDISVEINNNLNVTNNGGATVPNHVNIQPIHMDDEVNNESIRFNQECIDTINNFDEGDPAHTFTCPYQQQIEGLHKELQSHVVQYKAQRDYYNHLAVEVRRDYIINEKNYEERHDMFVFDFTQNFEIPFYGSDQPQNTYYYSPLSINVFGVYDCGKGHMNAFLYPEYESGKGPDDVSSLLMKNLTINDIEDCEIHGARKQLTLVCDNCSGQNKNGTVIKFYVCWLRKNITKKYNYCF